MKRILLSFIAIATATLSSFGQSPEGFKYQAVIRDAGNLILTNQAVGMQLTIQQGSIGGTAVYTETFSPTSNAFGLVNLEIGTGMSTDDFTLIDWANGPYFMETAVDITGGMTYEVMGTSQLMSVPYALYAKTSGNGEGPQGPTGAAGAVGAQGPAGEDGNDGVPGPQGLQGPAGADSTVPGPTGPAGADGITGQDGIDGAQGAQGIQGPAGENGINGPDGITGAQGPQGLTGPAGTNGIDGIDGDDGAQGIQGLTGATGPQGVNGQDGQDGTQGIQGLTGSTGPTGPVGTNGIDGIDGDDGAQGIQGLTGATGPQGNQGPAGDDGATGNNGINGAPGLQGPIGPAGDDGIQGLTGSIGPIGPAGTNGIDGIDGQDGAQGIQGLTGAQGPQGPAGTNGIDGIDGDDGAQGSTGLTGPAGANGNNGAAGATGLQGPIGLTGPAGANGTNGNDGATGSDGQDGADGITGQSAYEVWSNLGNTGSEADFIASLTGPAGVDGLDAAVDYDSLANIITADSSFAANFSGGIGRGCDISYPDGLDGNPITHDLSNPYTIPSGKNLYTNILSTSNLSTVYIDGIIVNEGLTGFSNYNGHRLKLVSSGQTISSNIEEDGLVTINGLLVDAIISPITHDLSNPYTIPSGKNLYTNILSTSNLSTVYIDGIIVNEGLTGFSNYNGHRLKLVSSGQTISSNIEEDGLVTINGYLADENYFAGCGGGSSNSASNATIDSLSQVVSTLDSTLTALTSLFVFGCMDPAAFNYNSSANINDGSCNFIPSIGDTYQGGIIFYLDGNGGGLIAAPSNQSSGASEWGCIGTSIGTGTAIGSGFQNTAMIELGCATPNTAADVCANLTLGGYNDWFLPSRYELVEMHQNIGQGNALGLGNIGGFANNYYWSSSEAFGGSSTAWIKYFGITTSGVNSWNKDELEYVRAIRVF